MNTKTAAPGEAPVERKVRAYPLDVVNCSGEDHYAVMSKGHHDSVAFKTAARDFWGESVDRWEPPKHLWWRAVPAPPDSDHRFFYADATPHSRGAFPATVMESY